MWHALHVRIGCAATAAACAGRVLSRGLKNFVLADNTSLDEAMAAARSDKERESTSHQLDAFHKTFNFCMYVPAVHLPELLERRRGALPLVRPAGDHRNRTRSRRGDQDRLRRLIAPTAAEASAPNGAVAAHVHVPEMVGAEEGAAEDAIADQAHEMSLPDTADRDPRTGGR